MASRAADSSSKPRISLEEIMEKDYESLIAKIKQLKTEIEAGRRMQVKEKLDRSGKKLGSHTSKLSSAAYMVDFSMENDSIEVPRVWGERALCVLDSVLSGSDDKDFTDIHEAISSSSITLPKIQRVPPFTTWTFLNRNQRMADEQSVVGRRRIYHDQFGNEALICSDTDDDLADIKEEKRAFSDGEDQIVWMAFQEHGLNEEVADVVCHFIGGTSSEILERYHELKQKHAQASTERNVLLEKSLSGALDSLDNLFCRRCLVFDCRLHGCSQTLVYPSEKPLGVLESEDGKPCSVQCYLVAGQTVDNPVEISNVNSSQQMEGSIVGGDNSGPRVRSKKNIEIDNANKLKSMEFEVDEGPTIGLLSVSKKLCTEGHQVVGKRKTFVDNGEQFQSTDSFKNAFEKQKNIQAAEVEIVSAKAFSSSETKILKVTVPGEKPSQLADKLLMKGLTSRVSHNSGDELCVVSKTKVLSCSSDWKPLEKDLYTKGLEIFGRNSCLIARNLLSGLKTCTEVFNYMRNNGAVMTHKKDAVRSLEDCPTADTDYTEQDILMRSRSRILRRRGRARRLTYSSKSSGLPSSWKKIGDENQASKQYSPCTCQAMCGKDCSCLKVGTCCEKFCGCPRSCKNRFRGCHCAKSQCRSRQCPCFAANRECDPDVCCNCWVSCGGGSLGEPLKKGDGQCGNMKILLKQQKRVLLGRSDLTGWGAFSKDIVNKNEYLGEYTGELISHQEADKRGEIYDLANSSFLFDLNNQYVLDACRHGNKLKFANHSSKPNCFCKVMLVGGDHRVGIFAKERIEAQEELFYDYCYGPDQAPEWARKLESSKKDDSVASQSRPRKHQSR